MKKWLRNLLIIGSVVVLVGGVYVTFMCLPRVQSIKGENTMMKDDETLPLLIAHGGGNKEFPDNTLEAFYNAYSVDENVMMETDVSITKDGVLILSHDRTLDRKTNVTGYIEDWNYSDLINQKVDFGYTNPVKYDDNDDAFLNGELVEFKTDDGIEVTPLDVKYPSDLELVDGVPEGRDKDVYLATTLEDLMTSFPNNSINVEIKQGGEVGLKALDEAIRLVEKYDAYDRVVLASFHEEIYQRMEEYKKENERFNYSPAMNSVVKFVVLHFLGLDYFYQDTVTVFQIPMEEYGINISSKSLIDTLHSHNIAVHYWTINDVEDMKYLIDVGADGIMTDYPHRLKDIYLNY